MILFKQIQDENFDDRGQGLLEYSLILFSIAVAVIIVLSPLGTRVMDLLLDVGNKWP